MLEPRRRAFPTFVSEPESDHRMTHQIAREPRPVPVPPPAGAPDAHAGRLTDIADRLQEAGDAPMEERVAALEAIHETLASELRRAED